ncbi:unnamed protein product, partial [Urochloa humidicola]
EVERHPFSFLQPHLPRVGRGLPTFCSSVFSPAHEASAPLESIAASLAPPPLAPPCRRQLLPAARLDLLLRVAARGRGGLAPPRRGTGRPPPAVAPLLRASLGGGRRALLLRRRMGRRPSSPSSPHMLAGEGEKKKEGMEIESRMLATSPSNQAGPVLSRAHPSLNRATMALNRRAAAQMVATACLDAVRACTPTARGLAAGAAMWRRSAFRERADEERRSRGKHRRKKKSKKMKRLIAATSRWGPLIRNKVGAF